MQTQDINVTGYPVRLHPGDDVKHSLARFVDKLKIKAGFVLTGVGSLSKVNLRLANTTDGEPNDTLVITDKKFEILSIAGTLSQSGTHLHLSLGDNQGKVIGGHLNAGCIVYTTVEIIIGDLNGFVFERQWDEKTKYKELKAQTI